MGHPAVAVFGEFELDRASYQLRRGGVVVPIEPKAFDLLCYLLDHRDRVVGKDELISHVWGDRFVTESALTTRLKAVRRTVGDSGTLQRVIKTVHGRGYQFVAAVTAAAAPGVAAPSTAAADQEIRYCTAHDGARIAYATMGSGPPLVKAANWLTHLDVERHNQVWRHWLEALSADHHLIRYDERGCGLSDWAVGAFTFEDWVDDLASVVDACGLDRFPLLGLSQGGAVAITYAAAHPERVSRLVLVGAYSRGRMVRATTPEAKEEAALDIDLARLAWRRSDDSFFDVFASQFIPGAGLEQRAAFNDLLRVTTSGENGGRFLSRFAEIDVGQLLPAVRCPTLVVQSRDDRRVPPSQGRELAAGIPDSRLVLLDSSNHLLTADEPAWLVFLAELRRFLGDGSSS